MQQGSEAQDTPALHNRAATGQLSVENLERILQNVGAPGMLFPPCGEACAWSATPCFPHYVCARAGGPFQSGVQQAPSALPEIQLGWLQRHPGLAAAAADYFGNAWPASPGLGISAAPSGLYVETARPQQQQQQQQGPPEFGGGQPATSTPLIPATHQTPALVCPVQPISNDWAGAFCNNRIHRAGPDARVSWSTSIFPARSTAPRAAAALAALLRALACTFCRCELVVRCASLDVTFSCLCVVELAFAAGSSGQCLAKQIHQRLKSS